MATRLCQWSQCPRERKLWFLWSHGSLAESLNGFFCTRGAKGMQPRRIRIRSELRPLTCDLKQGVVLCSDLCFLERPAAGNRSCRERGLAVAFGEFLRLWHRVNTVKIGVLKSRPPEVILLQSARVLICRLAVWCICSRLRFGAGVLLVLLLTFVERHDMLGCAA